MGDTFPRTGIRNLQDEHEAACSPLKVFKQKDIMWDRSQLKELPMAKAIAI